ncbi:MAG TPA: hypothetical protein VGD72_11665 [Mycobacteriales bacterium]
MTNPSEDVLHHFEPATSTLPLTAVPPVRASLHEVLDRALDLAESVAALARPFARPGLRSPVAPLARVRLRLAAFGRERSGGPSVLPLGPAAPDSKATGRLEVANEGTATRTDVALLCTGLVTDSLHRIDGKNVGFLPRAFTLPPGETDTVDVTVDVPRGARPGVYTGVVTVVGLPSIRTVLTLEVR